MKNIFKQLLVLLFFSIIAHGVSAQELAKERTTTYTFSLNRIKHQSQVDGVVEKAKEIPNVENCKLDWLNYKMELIVSEGGEKGNLSLEKIKSILIENNIDLVKFTKETVAK